MEKVWNVLSWVLMIGSLVAVVLRPGLYPLAVVLLVCVAVVETVRAARHKKADRRRLITFAAVAAIILFLRIY